MGPADVPNVLPSFVEAWNRTALAEGRDEWVIDLSFGTEPPSSRENTHGLQVYLGGEPPQLVVDAVATGERLSRLEVAVLRWDESSEDLLEDAFRIGVMTVIDTDEVSDVEVFVTELVEHSSRSPGNHMERLELPGGALAGAFSTSQAHVLGISWPSE